jgi:endonuclease/exonuclease/phosphatase family metal-dependent hydrolase
MSHADYVHLLIKKGIQADPVSVRLLVEEDHDHHGVSSSSAPPSPATLPAVMAKLTYQSRSLLVASVHLAPFREGEADRRRQIADVMALADKERGRQQEEEGLVPGVGGGGVPLLMAGDTNMRQSEDAGMELQQWTDFWQRAGRDPTTQFTKDTVDHGGTSFSNRFHGDWTREKTTRYDRVYYHHGGRAAVASSPPGAAVAVVGSAQTNNKKNKNGASLNVVTFELIANTPMTNNYHFLSDHFGVATTFELEWPME